MNIFACRFSGTKHSNTQKAVLPNQTRITSGFEWVTLGYGNTVTMVYPLLPYPKAEPRRVMAGQSKNVNLESGGV